MKKSFEEWLAESEYSKSTVEKYTHDAGEFLRYMNGRKITKEMTLAYKEKVAKKYLPRSVNSIISSLNAYFAFLERYDLRLKTVKVQRTIFTERSKELTKADYEKLLDCAAANDERLYYMLQTICATGIRVSELKFITVETINKKYAIINNKGKMRKILLPKALCAMLKSFAERSDIKSGSIFITRTGTPLDRSNIWRMIKGLCNDARIDADKVYPHNLRRLFARTFYDMQKDIVRLADILGHSSIDTTRIYTMETGEKHLRQIEKMGLIRE